MKEIDNNSDIILNKESNSSQQDIGDNNVQVVNESIPNKIKNSMNILTSEVVNATKQVGNQLEKVRISLITAIKQALNIPEVENKVPKG